MGVFLRTWMGLLGGVAGARCVYRRDVFSLLAVESAETYAKRQLLEGKGDVL